MNNEGFDVLKIEKIFFFMMFKVFFSMKNEGFEVPKTEKISFLYFKDFFVEE